MTGLQPDRSLIHFDRSASETPRPICTDLNPVVLCSWPVGVAARDADGAIQRQVYDAGVLCGVSGDWGVGDCVAEETAANSLMTGDVVHFEFGGRMKSP